jgi:hypothetical protein
MAALGLLNTNLNAPDFDYNYDFLEQQPTVSRRGSAESWIFDDINVDGTCSYTNSPTLKGMTSSVVFPGCLDSIYGPESSNSESSSPVCTFSSITTKITNTVRLIQLLQPLSGTQANLIIAITLLPHSKAPILQIQSLQSHPQTSPFHQAYTPFHEHTTQHSRPSHQLNPNSILSSPSPTISLPGRGTILPYH